MNKYLKSFLQRGAIFGGFGPIILGIIYAILDSTIPEFSLSGVQLLTGIVSVYFLAFIQAGASVFNQIESFSLPKSLLCHFTTLYVVYVSCYLLNSWIPFDPTVLLIFTAVFFTGYLFVWSVVVISIKLTSGKLNKKLSENLKNCEYYYDQKSS